MSNQGLSIVRKIAGLTPANVTAKQKYAALAVAAVADIVQGYFWPVTVEGAASPVEIGIDVATAAIIVLILGWNWRLALAFGIELIPGAALFPTWSAAVLTFAATTATAPSAAAPGSPALPGGTGGAPGGELPAGAPGEKKFAGMYAKRTRTR